MGDLAQQMLHIENLLQINKEKIINNKVIQELQKLFQTQIKTKLNKNKMNNRKC